MHLRALRFLAFALAAFLASGASAQFGLGSGNPDEGKVEATILDADGQPVAGAILFLAWDEPAANAGDPPSPRESFAGVSDETGSVVFTIAPGKRTLRAHTSPEAPKPTTSGAALIEVYGPVEIDLKAGETAYPVLAPSNRGELVLRLKPTIPGEPDFALAAITLHPLDPGDFALLGAKDFEAPGTLAIVQLATDRPTIVRGLPAGVARVVATRLDPGSGTSRSGVSIVSLEEGKPEQLTIEFSEPFETEGGAGLADTEPVEGVEAGK
jgi:hypothetical protein